MKRIPSYIILLLCCYAAMSQSKYEQDYDNAWKNYETGYYKEAVRIIEPYYKSDSAKSEVYQLLGNVYDESGDVTKANSIYDEGLRKYPKAANLMLEKGNSKFKQNKYSEALYWYEKGMETDPLFASNYYCAAKVYFLSTETVWGCMYGEIFMLLEQNTARTREMSKLLYDAYFASITFNYGKATVDFCNDLIVYSDSRERKNAFPEMFNSLMTEASNGKSFANIATLNNIRTKFISLVYAKRKDFGNVLFDYWKKLIQVGNFEAYNYWIFAYGNNKESSFWLKNNKQRLEKLQKYMKENPLHIDSTNLFTRYSME